MTTTDDLIHFDLGEIGPPCDMTGEPAARRTGVIADLTCPDCAAWMAEACAELDARYYPDAARVERDLAHGEVGGDD